MYSNFQLCLAAGSPRTSRDVGGIAGLVCVVHENGHLVVHIAAWVAKMAATESR